MEQENIFKWKHYQPDIILLVLLQKKSDRMKDARLSHNSHLSAGGSVAKFLKAS
ncbi:hypothetical protein [Bacillus sp. FSL R12-0069]|uniref:hypothetical protein n=1 Tax=Bacillus sp. FSL R12-0069 TaxID=2975342 RepID=UPI0030F9B4FB